MVLCLEKVNTISIFIVSLLMFYDHSEMPYTEITTDDIIKSLVTLCMNISMCVSDWIHICHSEVLNISFKTWTLVCSPEQLQLNINILSVNIKIIFKRGGQSAIPLP